jgi:cytochrome bd-type quinol oxidase subunit 2
VTPLAVSTVDLARVQFATTSIYHFLFVPLTLGLAPLVAVMQTLFTGLYPRVLVSDPSFANSLTVAGAASAHYALTVITVVAAIFLPLVLLYQGWSYHVFRARLGGGPATPAPAPVASGERAAAGAPSA